MNELFNLKIEYSKSSSYQVSSYISTILIQVNNGSRKLKPMIIDSTSRLTKLMKVHLFAIFSNSVDLTFLQRFVSIDIFDCTKQDFVSS